MFFDIKRTDKGFEFIKMHSTERFLTITPTPKMETAEAEVVNCWLVHGVDENNKVNKKRYKDFPTIRSAMIHAVWVAERDHQRQPSSQARVDHGYLFEDAPQVDDGITSKYRPPSNTGTKVRNLI